MTTRHTAGPATVTVSAATRRQEFRANVDETIVVGVTSDRGCTVTVDGEPLLVVDGPLRAGRSMRAAAGDHVMDVTAPPFATATVTVYIDTPDPVMDPWFTIDVRPVTFNAHVEWS